MMDKFLKDILGKVMGEGFPLEDLVFDFPPNIKLGDITINCFALAKKLHRGPNDIAKEIGEKLSGIDGLEKVDVTGAYVNITFNNKKLFEHILSAEEKTPAKNQKIMVEYLQPNTNKPLHLGHVRNGCLGMAISNILAANGNEVVKANLINDRGIHICKSMLAWKKWGNGETPESANMKGDHFVGKWYVRYSQEEQKNPELEKEARELLVKWEENDPETIELWKKMNAWVFSGFAQTNRNFGFLFDVEYFESKTYKVGKEIIQEGLDKKIFYKDTQGNVVVDLPEDKFGRDQNNNVKKVTLQRADGTSLYMTQDLGTAKLKFLEHKIDQSIYVVGSEQEYHFQCLFAILGMLGYELAKKSYHLSYGMVYLPEGKMKSREGKVVDADDLLVEMEQLAREEILKRIGDNKISQDEINQRAQKIGLGAIKFYLLKTNPHNDIYFNPQESISFDGFTGPYCQYAFARATKIIEKSEIKIDKSTAIKWEMLGNDEERVIGQKIINLEKQLKAAGEELNPAKVATAVYDLATAFNQFYQKHPVINAEDQELTKARLKLVDQVREKIASGLAVLGIDVLKEM